MKKLSTRMVEAIKMINEPQNQIRYVPFVEEVAQGEVALCTIKALIRHGLVTVGPQAKGEPGGRHVLYLTDSGKRFV